MNTGLEAARTYFLQGVADFEAGRLEAARAAFEQALALAPGRPSVLGNLGVTLYHLRQPERAATILKQALAADPQFPDGWACLGFSLEMLGRWQEAGEALEKAIAQAPKQSQLWFRKGQCMLRLGRVEPALQAFGQAVELDPGFGEAWSARGGVLRDLQQLPEAATCFEKALANGADAELNRYYLASVRGEVLPAPPRRYVEALFDDYAEDFQRHVVGQLRYQGYEQLLRPLIDEGRQYARAIDLGCGTGLCAPLLRQMAASLEGVDISAAMLEQAGKTGMYGALHHADVLSWLEAAGQQAGLIVAADVFIYIGDLRQVFRQARRLLSDGGCFAFTVELADGGQELQLLPSLRYAHSEAYIRRLAAESGFEVERMFRAPIRVDQAQPLDGHYFHLR